MHTCACRYPHSAEEGSGSPEAIVLGSSALICCGCWELTLDPLQELQVFSPAELLCGSFSFEIKRQRRIQDGFKAPCVSRARGPCASFKGRREEVTVD